MGASIQSAPGNNTLDENAFGDPVNATKKAKGTEDIFDASKSNNTRVIRLSKVQTQPRTGVKDRSSLQIQLHSADDESEAVNSTDRKNKSTFVDPRSPDRVMNSTHKLLGKQDRVQKAAVVVGNQEAEVLEM